MNPRMRDERCRRLRRATSVKRPFAANRAPTDGRVGQYICVREVQTRPALRSVSPLAIANMKESLVRWRTNALVAPNHGAVVTCKPGATLARPRAQAVDRLFAHLRVIERWLSKSLQCSFGHMRHPRPNASADHQEPWRLRRVCQRVLRTDRTTVRAVVWLSKERSREAFALSDEHRERLLAQGNHMIKVMCELMEQIIVGSRAAN